MSLLPPPDNDYRGSPLALWLLWLLVAVNAFRGCVHLLWDDSGAGRIAGIDLTANGAVIVHLLAQIGIDQLVWGAIQAATALAEKKAHEKGLVADFDGGLQVDAALVPEIAARKNPGGKIVGTATVLIFPDLNSGNIASRLVRHIARANAYGQILLGLDRPAADVSRGSSAHDILGVASIVGIQAIDYHMLYPGAGQSLPGE